jgi:hypothetical protein
VKATKSSNLTFNGPSTLTRVDADASSSIRTSTTATTSTISDTTVGNFHGDAGTIILAGTLTIGGVGTDSTLSVGLSGTGDFIMTAGVFTWNGGAITGSGEFIIQSGEAHFESGAALDRTTTAEEDAIVFIKGNPAFIMSAVLDAKGGAVFEQSGTNKIESVGGAARFNTWKDTFFGSDSIVGPAHHNYGNYQFDIQDRTTYDKVTFETEFETENSSFVFALDARTKFFYKTERIAPGEKYVKDIGNRFQIITLPSLFDIDACDCVTPFAGAVYTYNVSVRFPDREHENIRGARISTRNESSNKPTQYLYLYSDASSFRPLGMFFIVLLALLF